MLTAWVDFQGYRTRQPGAYVNKVAGRKDDDTAVDPISPVYTNADLTSIR